MVVALVAGSTVAADKTTDYPRWRGRGGCGMTSGPCGLAPQAGKCTLQEDARNRKSGKSSGYAEAL